MKLDKSAKLFQLLDVYMLSNVTLSLRLKFDSEILRLIYLVFIRCTGAHYFSVPSLFFPCLSKRMSYSCPQKDKKITLFQTFKNQPLVHYLRRKKEIARNNCSQHDDLKHIMLSLFIFYIIIYLFYFCC